MATSIKKRAMAKQSISILFMALMACMFMFYSTGHAEWQFGIGTGMSMVNIDGEMGVDTEIVGPVEFDVELDPSEFSDAVDTALGFGGFITDGTWLINYKYFHVELEGDDSKTVGGSKVSLDANFDMTTAELTVGYPVYKTPSLNILVDGGLRYTKHELGADLKVTGNVNRSRSNDIDNDWTDALVGVMINVPFAKEWSWNNHLNAGFGGSLGTYFASTGVSWRFHKHWLAGVAGTFTAVDFENEEKGDDDWYRYDVDESTLGFIVQYIF